MNVSLVQMDVAFCRKQHNLQRALEFSGTCDTDMVVFPEVFTTGFCYDRIDEIAESEPYPTIEMLRQMSKAYNNIIIGSIIISAPGGRFYNLGFVLDNGEVAGTYKKVHPFGAEKHHFTAGDSIEPIRTSQGLVGLMICYDIRFPEMARKLALDGVDILVTVAQFPSLRQEHWDVLVRARAIENQVPHAACNRVGADPSNVFGGGSVIIDGRGRVLADACSVEKVISAHVDMGDKVRIRNEITCFSDRCETLY
ncbi:MAG: carbon-nitrogen family hydrolase [ANME-2 cluster archaeon]|nr:carbon-nitrogen family hydrolase [ANME-2 cluster archaeon]